MLLEPTISLLVALEYRLLHPKHEERLQLRVSAAWPLVRVCDSQSESKYNPFQSLVPFKVKGPGNIPYVESRVRNLVCADPHVFLTPWSNDKDEKEAIVPYIDN